MEKVMRESPWAKDRPVEDLDFAEFLKHLRQDQFFYFETEEEMLREYAVIAKEVDLHLAKLFGRLPRLPFGLEEMDPSIAERAPLRIIILARRKMESQDVLLLIPLSSMNVQSMRW